MSQIDEDIDRFCGYFREQIKLIAQAEDGLHARILWVALLDAISQAAHPSLGRKNHERIVRFLKNSVNWDLRDRCSLPQIKLNLEHLQMVHGKLYAFAESQLLKWETDTIYEPTDEPTKEVLLKLANCDCERKVIKICRYTELFYSYRNWLVHGFRVPGYGMDLSSTREGPYYLSSESDGKITWELVFPPKLFEQIVTVGLEALRGQLKEQRRNPYDAYEFGSKW